MPDPVYDPIAAFAATLAASGVKEVVISPGSRSTPLTLTFHARPDLRTWIQIDERSAGYFALGQARATGIPSVLICTSGTAVANYLPAVVEANHAGVPLIVCTADRPPELRQWGAGQTIDQVNIFGSNVRWFADFPFPSDWSTEAAAIAAMRAVSMATGDRRGPVHCNWPLREPLEPLVGVPVCEARTASRAPAIPATPTPTPTPASATLLPEETAKGLIVVGPDAACGLDNEQRLADDIVGFAAARKWPVLAEPISQLRSARGANEVVIDAADHLLSHSPCDDLVPEVVVRVGATPTSKPVRQWLARVRPERVVLVDPEQRWADPSFTTTEHQRLTPAALFAAAGPGQGLSGLASGEWLESWLARNLAAQTAVELVLAATVQRSSASVVRDLVAGLPAGATVMVSNSLPVRDLDAFVVNGSSARFVGNRGASGIDGITSTGVGLASVSREPVVVLTGDLALLHDVGALFGVARLGLHITVVVIDNNGGAIFSRLPIARQRATIDYDTLFRTAHGLDLANFDGVGGVRVRRVRETDDVASMVAAATSVTEPGVDLILIELDPDDDLAVRVAIHAAVGEALAL